LNEKNGTGQVVNSCVVSSRMTMQTDINNVIK